MKPWVLDSISYKKKERKRTQTRFVKDEMNGSHLKKKKAGGNRVRATPRSLLRLASTTLQNLCPFDLRNHRLCKDFEPGYPLLITYLCHPSFGTKIQNFLVFP